MKKLNGWRPTHKNKWLLVSYSILTSMELSLLEFYADIMDFDFKHGEKQGLIEVYYDEIAKFFKCSENTIRNRHNKLLYLGFINETSRKRIYRLACYERYITPGIQWKGKASKYEELERNQPIEIILQSFGLDLQTIEEKLQNIGKKLKERTVIKPNTDSRGLGSSKDGYKDTPLSHTKDEAEEEIEYQKLTDDDMEWIIKNVHEQPAIPS